MIRQTVLSFKLERTDETLTAYGGLARHTLVTLRWTLVQVAGCIVRHAGQAGHRFATPADQL